MPGNGGVKPVGEARWVGPELLGLGSRGRWEGTHLDSRGLRHRLCAEAADAPILDDELHCDEAVLGIVPKALGLGRNYGPRLELPLLIFGLRTVDAVRASDPGGVGRAPHLRSLVEESNVDLDRIRRHSARNDTARPRRLAFPWRRSLQGRRTEAWVHAEMGTRMALFTRTCGIFPAATAW